jgi:hypothetical protein
MLSCLIKHSNNFSLFTNIFDHVRCVSCHHGMAYHQVVDGGDDLQVWKVAVNVLDKQSQTADKG